MKITKDNLNIIIDILIKREKMIPITKTKSNKMRTETMNKEANKITTINHQIKNKTLNQIPQN